MIRLITSFLFNVARLLKHYYTLLRLGFLFSEKLGCSKKRTCKQGIRVLANGPSLKNDIPHIVEQNKNGKYDYIVLNFFAMDEVFYKLKPRYYCFADPMFFEKDRRYEKVMALFHVLNTKVDWDMTIYVPKEKIGAFLSFSGLNNSHLKIKGVIATQYKSFECLRNWHYEKGLALPCLGTVAILSIYAAINLGYKYIELFGLDHTFFDGICVDENSHLCRRIAHFNDKQYTLEPEWKSDGVHTKVSEYLFEMAEIFRSHDLLANYASYVGAKIINKTNNSLIDSYIRHE